MDQLVAMESELEDLERSMDDRFEHRDQRAERHAAGPGRLRDLSLGRADRSWAIGTHLAMIPAIWMLNMLAPLVALPIYFFVRDRSPYLLDHAREALNLSITAAFVTLLWLIPIVGWGLALVWMIVATIGAVRGAMAADRSEYFRYPMVFRFVH